MIVKEQVRWVQSEVLWSPVAAANSLAVAGDGVQGRLHIPSILLVAQPMFRSRPSKYVAGALYAELLELRFERSQSCTGCLTNIHIP